MYLSEHLTGAVHIAAVFFLLELWIFIILDTSPVESSQGWIAADSSGLSRFCQWDTVVSLCDELILGGTLM